MVGRLREGNRVGTPAAKLVQLRRDIQEGLDSGSVGKLDVEVIKRRGRARLDAAKTNRDKK